MPSQSDYGERAEPQLVPQSLRVYRHFAVDTHFGALWRMGSGFMRREDRRDQTYMGGSRGPYELPGDSGLYQAKCLKTSPWAVPPHHAHEEAPDRACRCGFYASYDPREDFYSGSYWGPEYVKEFAQPHNSFDISEAADYVIVRAVCEVQGRVIMGRLGVRAEKMKIVAVAIDWSKYMYEERPSRDINWNDPGDILRIGRGRPAYVDYWSNRSWKTGMPPRTGKRYVFDTSYNVWDVKDDDPMIPVKMLDNVSEVEDKVKRQLAKYGVKFYTDVDKMHTEHPKPDLSALGLEPEPEPEAATNGPFTVTVTANGNITVGGNVAPQRVQGFTGYQQQLNTYQALLADPAAVRQTLFPSGGRTPKKKKPKVKPVADERTRKVIEAKQNRQAPPGTGIDRRKGRLR